MTPVRAHSIYTARCEQVRLAHPRATAAYADAMSAACREYEDNMRRAAQQGDAEAVVTLSRSAGPYLRNVC